MKFELLSEKLFNMNFGSFTDLELFWKEIDESVVDLLLYSRYKDKSKDIKEQILKGECYATIVGFIRLKTDLEKCTLCGSSFKSPFHSLSIVDNKTKICSNCGLREQLERYTGTYDR
ncbi:MAG: hypothetical protein IJH34_05230 [Romboutsia sp.]|nr:hypothetical protein [Romboutsia sp.]